MTEFVRKSDYHEESDCGRFSIAAVKTKGRWSFEAWRMGASTYLLGSFDTAEEARQCCRQTAASEDQPEQRAGGDE